MQLHHINIRAPADLLADEMVFFRDILGLTEGPRPAFISPGYWLYSGDQPIVHLSQGERHIGAERGGYFDHVAFQTTGLGVFMRRLENAGIEYSTSYIDATATTQVFIDSPTGTKIEVSFADEIL
jgi:catechol 2,3-dioxygenase-like lactoylglutathione lyase family enzyme